MPSRDIGLVEIVQRGAWCDCMDCVFVYIPGEGTGCGEGVDESGDMSCAF